MLPSLASSAATGSCAPGLGMKAPILSKRPWNCALYCPKGSCWAEAKTGRAATMAEAEKRIVMEVVARKPSGEGKRDTRAVLDESPLDGDEDNGGLRDERNGRTEVMRVNG